MWSFLSKSVLSLPFQSAFSPCNNVRSHLALDDSDEVWFRFEKSEYSAVSLDVEGEAIGTSVKLFSRAFGASENLLLSLTTLPS